MEKRYLKLVGLRLAGDRVADNVLADIDALMDSTQVVYTDDGFVEMARKAEMVVLTKDRLIRMHADAQDERDTLTHPPYRVGWG